ncbi:HSP20 family molecular chaperone IbpA [Anoxybacillus calidus]|jgi:spore coat protein M|uniref:HSP20 family molecular chaperone IbpA n=1 Tax=[Anoxybacillus] calidus TaxID=575178 RepID=A0A7V9YZ61_9BACL|nr:Hsp20/alpha crystallin family protein [Anoxybacillus calidus]MBA2870988.1 HSP20 family molecular chaperone IbpA [Anoxybacillus calidus]
MGSKKEPNEFEKWLEILLADPFTDYLDETIFRVDVFETEEHYIIEANLPLCTVNQIKVKCHNNTAIIQAYEQNNDYKERSVQLPFTLTDRDVRAYFENDILEVRISKDTIDKCKENVRNIRVSHEGY